MHYIVRIVSELRRLGYQVRCQRLEACDYGDPQVRPRLILTAAKNYIPMPPAPEPTHGDGFKQIPFVTCGEVLEPIRANPKLPNYDVRRSTSLQAGESKIVQLDANKPASTIKGSGPVLHYGVGHPPISVRETATLQSFPSSYELKGTMTQQYRQVGNAVPVQLAAAIARSLKPSLQPMYSEDH